MSTHTEMTTDVTTEWAFKVIKAVLDILFLLSFPCGHSPPASTSLLGPLWLFEGRLRQLNNKTPVSATSPANRLSACAW